ncbi:transmembrane protein 160 [Salminus brasiliensis]|uniref:transmembrane protein 160 n=1 Tax=Salminus brasiliensis TaxID=930266 RepID=UPI003B836B81
MASLCWLSCRYLRRFASPLVQVARRPGAVRAERRLQRETCRGFAEKSAWRKTAVEQKELTDLDRADALMLRKSHETGFLSWFRNGLLATGIGVIAYVQSDVGREAGYAFFILGGLCVSFGGMSYVASLAAYRYIMLLTLPAALFQCTVVSLAGLLWLCAVSLYIGRLEVEIIRDEDEDEEGGEEGSECAECRARQDRHHTNERGQEK